MAIFSNTGFYGFLVSCKKEWGAHVKSFTSGAKGTGWRLGKDEQDTSEFPEYVFEIDTVQVRDRICSVDYKQGVSDMTRKGFQVETDYTLPGGEQLTGYSRAEFDEILVRRRSVFKEILIEQINSVAGGIVISAAHAKVAAVQSVQNGWYLALDEDASGNAPFYRGDMVLCERTYPEKNGEGYYSKAYWRLVKEVGETARLTLYPALRNAGMRYLFLSRTECEAGSGEPEAGDVMVQFGYIGVVDLGDAALTSGDRELRRRALMLAPLTRSRAAFTEYKGLGALPEGTNPVVVSDYFRIVPDYHESIRICGNGTNKFTGEMHITAKGTSTSTNAVDYVSSLGSLSESLESIKDFDEGIFCGKVGSEAEKAALLGKLHLLEKTKLELEKEIASVSENETLKGVRPRYSDDDRVKQARETMENLYQEYQSYAEPLMRVLDDLIESIWNYKGSVPDPNGSEGAPETNDPEWNYQTFMILYEDYVYAYKNLIAAINNYNDLDFKTFSTNIITTADSISSKMEGEIKDFEKTLAGIEVSQKNIELYAESQVLGEEIKYGKAGISIGTDSDNSPSYIEMEAEKIQIKGVGEGDSSLLELMPRQISLGVKGKYKEAGLELLLEKSTGKSSLLLYGDQVEILAQEGDTKSFLDFSEKHFVAAVQDPYKKVGLEMSAQDEVSRICLEAGKTRIQAGGKTAALFVNGAMNADFIETENLIVRGSLAEIPRPIDWENASTGIQLDFGKGFNFAGHYEHNSGEDIELYLPTDKKYNGVRSTIINTGKAANSSTLVVKFPDVPKDDPSALHWYSFHANRNLRTVGYNYDHRDKEIKEVRIPPGGILKMYAYLSQITKEKEDGSSLESSELFWYIENISDFAQYSMINTDLVFQNYNRGVKLVPVAIECFMYTRPSANSTDPTDHGRVTPYTLIGKFTKESVFLTPTTSSYDGTIRDNPGESPSRYKVDIKFEFKKHTFAGHRKAFARVIPLCNQSEPPCFYPRVSMDGDTILVNLTAKLFTGDAIYPPHFKLEVYEYGF